MAERPNLAAHRRLFEEDAQIVGNEVVHMWQRKMTDQAATIREQAEEIKRLRDALGAAVPELRRLAAIIDGRHEARLVVPHGQSSARSHIALEKAREALSEKQND